MVLRDGPPARSQHPSWELGWARRLPGLCQCRCIAGRVAGLLSGRLLCPCCPLESLGHCGALRVGSLTQRRLGSSVLQPVCDVRVCAVSGEGRQGRRTSGECNPSPAPHPWPLGASGRALAVSGGVPGWRRQTPCGPETVTQAAIMCLFLRIAKVREGFSTGRIMQVSTEMFFKSFFVLSQNTETELFP